MRRVANSIARALGEQAIAGDQVSNEANQLVQQSNEISKAVAEQAKASAEITMATQSMRLQSDQVAKAMREQARTAHEMTVGVAAVSTEAVRITNSNRNHLESAEKIRGAVTELRQITNRNADGVKATLTTTSGLADRARQLGEIMDTIITGNGNQQSQPANKPKRRRASKSAAETNSSE
jgi:methyl-accepting chemotaxis protein